MIRLNPILLTEGMKEDPFVLEMSKYFSKLIFTAFQGMLPLFSGVSKRDALIATDVFLNTNIFKIDLSKPGHNWVVPGAEERSAALKINDIEIKVELSSDFSAHAYFLPDRPALRAELQKIKDDILAEEDKKRNRYKDLRQEGLESIKNMTYFDKTKEAELNQLDAYFKAPDYVEKIKKSIKTKQDEFKQQNKHKYDKVNIIKCFIRIPANETLIETKPNVCRYCKANLLQRGPSGIPLGQRSKTIKQKLPVIPNVCPSCGKSTTEYSINKSIFPNIRKEVYSTLLHEIRHAHQNTKKDFLDDQPSRSTVKIETIYDLSETDISKRIKRFDPDFAPEVQLYDIKSIMKYFPIPTKTGLSIVSKSYSTYFLNENEIESFAEQYMFETKDFKKEQIKKYMKNIRQETENGNTSKVKSLSKDLEQFKQKPLIDHFIKLITEKFEEFKWSTDNFLNKFKTIAIENKIHKIFKKNNIYGQDGNILTTKEIKDNFIGAVYSLINTKRRHYEKCAEYIKAKYDKGGKDKLSDTSKKIYNIEKLKTNLDILEQNLLNDFRSKVENDYTQIGEPNLSGRAVDVDWNKP